MNSDITPPKTTQAAISARRSMPLSVILPNFNHGGLIARALRALLDQTPVASEIIVVDDGSTDNSVEVVEAFQRQDASIRLSRDEGNRGIIVSVKTAIEVATANICYLPRLMILFFPDCSVMPWQG